VVDSSGAGCPAWPLPQCPHSLRQSRVSAVLRCAGCRCPAGRLRCPRGRTAGIHRQRRPGPGDQRGRASATCAALPSRRNGGRGSAPSCRSRPGDRTPRVGIWVAAEPDTADALAVRCCFRNRGRCPDGWPVSGRLAGVRTVGRCPDGWCPPRTLPRLWCPLLPEAVAGQTAAGRVPPPPVGAGELALQLGAHVGHGRPLQR
jgi:hypothetical protein